MSNDSNVFLFAFPHDKIQTYVLYRSDHVHPQIPTIQDASRNVKFAEWIIYLQRSRKLKQCPRCRDPLKKNNATKSMLHNQIWICMGCAMWEVEEWAYVVWPPWHFEDWLWFGDFKKECEKYHVDWHLSDSKRSQK